MRPARRRGRRQRWRSLATSSGARSTASFKSPIAAAWVRAPPLAWIFTAFLPPTSAPATQPPAARRRSPSSRCPPRLVGVARRRGLQVAARHDEDGQMPSSIGRRRPGAGHAGRVEDQLRRDVQVLAEGGAHFGPRQQRAHALGRRLRGARRALSPRPGRARGREIRPGRHGRAMDSSRCPFLPESLPGPGARGYFLPISAEAGNPMLPSVAGSPVARGPDGPRRPARSW